MSRLPGEFEAQRAVVMLFPSRNDVWRKECKPIRESMVSLANILSEYVPVIMGVLPELMEAAKNEYSFKEGVELVKMKYNDCWARDSISSVMLDDEKYISTFGFNAYGGELYAEWGDDDRLDYAISKIGAVNNFLMQQVDEKFTFEETVELLKGIFADG